MTRQNSSDVTTWTSCAPGTLTQLNRRLHATRQRRTVTQIAVPALVLACVGFGMWSIARPTTPAEFSFGGVTCAEVQSKLHQYAMGHLSAEVQRPFEIHLAKCPRCQKKMKAMQNDVAVQVRLSAEIRWEYICAESFAVHRRLVASRLQ